MLQTADVSTKPRYNTAENEHIANTKKKKFVNQKRVFKSNYIFNNAPASLVNQTDDHIREGRADDIRNNNTLYYTDESDVPTSVNGLNSGTSSKPPL